MKRQHIASMAVVSASIFAASLSYTPISLTAIAE
jgi:hypothetical protein